MDFTFGILTDGQQDARVMSILQSIWAEQMPTYEILVVGNSHVAGENVRVICNTDTETQQNGRAWITKKKNIIAHEAQYENIVFMHDYFQLQPGWYAGWEAFNHTDPHWQLAVNFIYTLEGPRHSDWVLTPYDMWYLFPELKDTWTMLLPADESSLTRFQYISGGYWVSKASFARAYPQLEQYGWGESEDVYWSQMVRQKTTFRFNPQSSVKLLKPGKWQPGLMPTAYVSFLKRLNVWLEQHHD